MHGNGVVTWYNRHDVHCTRVVSDKIYVSILWIYWNETYFDIYECKL